MGQFDSILAEAAKIGVDVVVSGSLTFTRTTEPYSSQSGPGAPSIETFEVKTAPPRGFSAREIDGTLIQAGDLRVLVPALNIPAAMGEPDKDKDTVTIDGKAWRIITIEPIRGGDSIAAYRLQLRR